MASLRCTKSIKANTSSVSHLVEVQALLLLLTVDDAEFVEPDIELKYSEDIL